MLIFFEQWSIMLWTIPFKLPDWNSKFSHTLLALIIIKTVLSSLMNKRQSPFRTKWKLHMNWRSIEKGRRPKRNETQPRLGQALQPNCPSSTRAETRARLQPRLRSELRNPQSSQTNQPRSPTARHNTQPEINKVLTLERTQRSIVWQGLPPAVAVAEYKINLFSAKFVVCALVYAKSLLWYRDFVFHFGSNKQISSLSSFECTVYCQHICSPTFNSHVWLNATFHRERNQMLCNAPSSI